VKSMQSLVKLRWRCWKCQGALKEETVQLQSGLVVKQYGCVVCHRKWPAGIKPQQAIAA